MTEDRRAWTKMFDNLPLKGFSLLLAIGLWTVVPDPSILHIVPGVPVRLDNVPADLALAANLTVALEVSVRGSAVRTRSLSPGEGGPRRPCRPCDESLCRR